MNININITVMVIHNHPYDIQLNGLMRYFCKTCLKQSMIKLLALKQK